MKWNLQDVYKQEKEKQPGSSFIETAIRDESKQSTVYHRYYHMFLKGEMEKLIEANFS